MRRTRQLLGVVVWPWVLESELGEAGGGSTGDERPSGVRRAQWGQRITGVQQGSTEDSPPWAAVRL